MRLHMATLAALLAAAAPAQTSTADGILQSAKFRAAQGQRLIWVMFHASW